MKKKKINYQPLNSNSTTNVVLYCRVSTDEQADSGFSLNYQEGWLRDYCERYGFNIIQVFIEDHSARNFNRPVWNDLKKFVKTNKGTVDKILFTRWDRFSRNIEQALGVIREFNNWGVEINSSDQYIDLENSDNKLMLSIYLTAGEVERDKISQRTTAGTYQAKLEGYYAHRPPYGYSTIGGKRKALKGGVQAKRSQLLPNDEAKFVTMAFNEVAKGIEPVEIIRKRLNAEGMKLRKSSFSRMLKNIVYAGKIEVPAYKKIPAKLVDGKHEPLIDLDTFLKVQKIFKIKRWRNLGNNLKHNDFPLRNFVVCDCCGEPLTASYSRGRKGTYGYYHGRHTCKARVKKESAEVSIETLLRSIRIAPNIKDLFADVLKDSTAEAKGLKNNSIAQKKKRIEEINSQLNYADDQFLEKKMPADRYGLIVKRLSHEVTTLNLEIEALQQTTSHLDVNVKAGLHLLENLDQFYASCDIDGKRMLLGSLFTDKLVLGKNECRTAGMNEVLKLLTNIHEGFELSNKKKLSEFDSFSTLVPGAGIEPAQPFRATGF